MRSKRYFTESNCSTAMFLEPFPERFCDDFLLAVGFLAVDFPL